MCRLLQEQSMFDARKFRYQPFFNKHPRTPARHFAGMTKTDDAFKPTRNVLRKITPFAAGVVKKAEKQRPPFACKMQCEELRRFATVVVKRQ